MDTYSNFTEMQKTEKANQDFCIETRIIAGANTLIIAPHGSGIEPGTSEITKQIASNLFSYAIFEGIKKNNNRILHLTSTNFDEPICSALVQKNETILSIHGENSSSNIKCWIRPLFS